RTRNNVGASFPWRSGRRSEYPDPRSGTDEAHRPPFPEANMKTLAAATLCLALLPAADADPKPPSKEQVAGWVRELGDGNFSTRERASEQLWKAGRIAEPALRAALQSDDAEVVRRARIILDRFKWGLYPDTPGEIVELVKQYRDGEPQAKQAVLEKLFTKRAPAYPVLAKVAAAEEDEGTRKALLQRIEQEVARSAG